MPYPRETIQSGQGPSVDVFRGEFCPLKRELGFGGSKPLTRQAKLTKMLGFHKVSPPSSSGPMGSNFW